MKLHPIKELQNLSKLTTEEQIAYFLQNGYRREKYDNTTTKLSFRGRNFFERTKNFINRFINLESTYPVVFISEDSVQIETINRETDRVNSYTLTNSTLLDRIKGTEGSQVITSIEHKDGDKYIETCDTSNINHPLSIINNYGNECFDTPYANAELLKREINKSEYCKRHRNYSNSDNVYAMLKELNQLSSLSHDDLMNVFKDKEYTIKKEKQQNIFSRPPIAGNKEESSIRVEIDNKEPNNFRIYYAFKDENNSDIDIELHVEKRREDDSSFVLQRVKITNEYDKNRNAEERKVMNIQTGETLYKSHLIERLDVFEDTMYGIYKRISEHNLLTPLYTAKEESRETLGYNTGRLKNAFPRLG